MVDADLFPEDAEEMKPMRDNEANDRKYSSTEGGQAVAAPVVVSDLRIQIHIKLLFVKSFLKQFVDIIIYNTRNQIFHAGGKDTKTIRSLFDSSKCSKYKILKGSIESTIKVLLQAT